MSINFTEAMRQVNLAQPPRMYMRDECYFFGYVVYRTPENPIGCGKGYGNWIAVVGIPHDMTEPRLDEEEDTTCFPLDVRTCKWELCLMEYTPWGSGCDVEYFAGARTLEEAVRETVRIHNDEEFSLGDLNSPRRLPSCLLRDALAENSAPDIEQCTEWLGDARDAWI